MQLDIIVRGQSNAAYLMELDGGVAARALIAEVQRLLGFDGVNDRVNIVYNRDGQGGETAYSGTAFLGEWMTRTATGWQAGPLEQGFLQAMNDYKASGMGDATIMLWMHSEYDSRDPNLSSTEWANAVRSDAALVRQSLGREVPYLFVAAHPYGDGTDTGHQAIRRGMEALVADPNFDARIAARAPDIDASLDDLDGNPSTIEYGFAHITPADAQLIASRIARAVAEEWAGFARPGSPVAQSGGNIADTGPRVVAATRLNANQVQVDVVHDGATGFAPLDPDAAAGIGWSVAMPNGTRMSASGASILDGDSIVITFPQPLPASAVLDYAWGIGRVANWNEPGAGNAVLDNTGLPIWTPAQGVPISNALTGGDSGHSAENDFNGDGRSDILFRVSSDSSVAVVMLDGTQVAGSGSAGPAGASWLIAGTADFNGDGRSDIVWRNTDGSVAVWEMIGSSQLGGGYVGAAGLEWSIAGTGDFDGNGRGDLLWRSADGGVAIWHMNGVAVEGSALVGAAGLEWSVAGTGDFNGDGRSDILWRSADGSVAIWMMDGGNVVGGGVVGGAGPEWSIAGVGDFNGDGQSDILWRAADGRVAVWQMDGTTVETSGVLGLNPGNAWTIVDVGDYDGNGREDILWRGPVGEHGYWTVNGTVQEGGGLLSVPISADWQIAIT